MSRNTRIAVALSGIWLAIIVLTLAVEYVRVLPGQCLFGNGQPKEVLPLEGTFLSCHWWSVVGEGSWWGTALLHVGHQVIEVDVMKLCFATCGPLLAFWFVFAVVPFLWRWVRAGAGGGGA